MALVVVVATLQVYLLLPPELYIQFRLAAAAVLAAVALRAFRLEPVVMVMVMVAAAVQPVQAVVQVLAAAAAAAHSY